MQMHISKLIYLGLLLASSLGVQAQTEKDIIGKWKNAADDSFQTEIYVANDGKYYGKVINHTKTPADNGKIILKSFSYEKEKQLFTGKMTPSDAKITITAEIKFLNADELQITARKLLFTKKMNLIRIK